LEQTLLSREELARRWNVTVTTIINYENSGVITRNPKIPTPRYSLQEIAKLEGTDLNPMSPMEKRRLQKEIEDLNKKLERQSEQLRKYASLGIESMSLLSAL